MAEITAMADDISDTMHCIDHPFRTLNPGAICSLCLQEKLGKLVSSSSNTPFPLSPSSSPSPSNTNNASKPPFIPSSSSHKKIATIEDNCAVPVALQKCKSLVSVESPRKKTFWSFLYHSSNSSTSSHATRKSISYVNNEAKVYEFDNHSPAATTPGSNASFGQKVGRSRSVGCGSRSFSGDFLERLSTGFGDCTLRRIESHREPKPRIVTNHSEDHQRHKKARDRIKCGGIFGVGSSNWLEASAEDEEVGDSVKVGNSAVGRHRGWGWTLASPMRAFRPVNSSSSSMKHACSRKDGGVNGGQAVDRINGGNGRHSVVGNGCDVIDKQGYVAV